MTSKSPVRSCEDVDATALSYAEIKMLAADNPHIKEKMDLDIQVQKLRLLKSNYLSEKYELEDKIIKYYPTTIARIKETIAGLEKDRSIAKEHPKPLEDTFAGIEVKGVSYSEKAEGGQKIIDACKEIRKNSQVPIIMLTAKGEEIDRILGLELGADDYIVKPFSPREVVARIKAVLRRTSEQQSNDDGRVTLNGLVIDIKSYTVTLKGQPVICTPKEIEILYMLASNPGQVFTREQLLNKVWGYDFAGETRTVDTHIKRIRAKLDNTGLNWSIKTIYGVGYKFEVE